MNVTRAPCCLKFKLNQARRSDLSVPVRDVRHPCGFMKRAVGSKITSVTINDDNDGGTENREKSHSDDGCRFLFFFSFFRYSSRSRGRSFQVIEAEYLEQGEKGRGEYINEGKRKSYKRRWKKMRKMHEEKSDWKNGDRPRSLYSFSLFNENSCVARCKMKSSNAPEIEIPMMLEIPANPPPIGYSPRYLRTHINTYGHTLTHAYTLFDKACPRDILYFNRSQISLGIRYWSFLLPSVSLTFSQLTVK